MPNIVSACCHSVVRRAGVLDDPYYGVYFGIDVCEECGGETEQIEVCSYCGAELGDGNAVIPVGTYEYCRMCVDEVISA